MVRLLIRKTKGISRKNLRWGPRSHGYLVKDTSKPFHTDSGYLTPEALASEEGTVISSNTGAEFVSFTPSFLDLYNRIQRGAQIIPLKDIGSIITTTGIGKDSIVVDAGAGSGGLSLMLAHIAKEVVTYEMRDDHYEHVRKNANWLGLDNLTIKKGDAYQGFDETDVDVVTLDLPEPWQVVPHLTRTLRIGGYVVVYNPSIPQVSDFCETIRDHEQFEIQKIIEILERPWEMEGRKVRPRTQGIGHSGFLCFARRLQR